MGHMIMTTPLLEMVLILRRVLAVINLPYLPNLKFLFHRLYVCILRARVQPTLDPYA